MEVIKTKHIQTGADLYEYMAELLEQKKAETEKLRKESPLARVLGEQLSAFPSLLTYLLSLWAVAEKYRNSGKITFPLIAQMLEEAFTAPPKQVNWEALLKEPYVPKYEGEPNTPEYFKEIKKYDYLEKTLRNYVACLKLLITYGPEKLGVGPDEERATASRYYWDNYTYTTRSFLEAGMALLEEATDSDEDVSWVDMVFILNDGRYN